MATILIKRYQREEDIPSRGLQAGELIIALDSRSLWMCISSDERVKVSANINPGDFLQAALNLSDVPDKERARLNLDIYSKAEIDHFLQGLKWKAPVRAATDRNISLRDEQEIDGILVRSGDRVLVNGQSARENNGIYVVAANEWLRAEDADASTELLNAAVFVSEGSKYSDTAWVCSTDPPIVLGSSSIKFVQFSALTYVHPSGFTSQPAGANLSGATVISRIIVTSEGHVNGITTRNLTPANIGAAPASHSHSLLTRGNGLTGSNYDGSAPVTWAVDFAGNGQAVTVARSDHNHDNQYAPYGHNHYLASLADVIIDSPEEGQVLGYDAGLSVWCNYRLPGPPEYWNRDTANSVLSPSFGGDGVYIESSSQILPFQVINNHAPSAEFSVAVYGSCNNGIGLYGYGKQYGLFVESVETGIYAWSEEGIAIAANTNSGVAASFYAGGDGGGLQVIVDDTGSGVGASIYCRNGLPLSAGCNTDYDTGIHTILLLHRDFAGGPGVDGIGGAIDFHIQGSGTSYLNSRFASTLTTAQNINITSNFEWSLISNGYFRQVMELSGGGVLTVNSGFATLAGSGISGTFNMLTAIGVESGTRNLIIGRSSITLSGGIVIAHEDLSNIIIPLP